MGYQETPEEDTIMTFTMDESKDFYGSADLELRKQLIEERRKFFENLSLEELEKMLEGTWEIEKPIKN